MLADERRALIRQEIHATGFADAAAIASRLKVSRVTIWRDIDRLANAGVVIKVHGGATGPDGSDTLVARPGRQSRDDLIVGMQVPTQDYYFHDIIEGAREVCTDFGARLILEVHGYGELRSTRESLAEMRSAGAAGFLLTPQPDPQRPTSGMDSEFLRLVDAPLVLVEREVAGRAGPAAASVVTAHEAGVYIGMEHLAQLGHERVGLLVRSDQSSTRERLVNGFRVATQDLLGASDAPTWESGMPVGRILEDVRSARITALLIFGDSVAVRFLRQIQAVGWQVPHDLSIVSYDDQIAADSVPALTAIAPPLRELGRTAARQLLVHLRGGDELMGRRIQLEPTLVIRESSAPAGTDPQGN